MPSKLLYRITLTGVDLTPELLPDDLRERIARTSLCGDTSRNGQKFVDTTITMNVGSVGEGLQALQRAQALRPELIEDAVLHIDYEYEAQCNLELSSDEMRSLAQAGGTLAISCWETPVVGKNSAIPVAPWRPLSEIESTSFWRGAVFRFPAKWPYEAFVDYMLVSDEAGDGELRMLATTGRKSGLMNILCRFPPEAYVAGAIAIKSDWLQANWCEYVYDECAMHEVYVSQGYAAPVDSAGKMTL